MSRVLTPEEIADRDRKALAELGCLYCELSAVLEGLDSAIDEVELDEIPDSDVLNRMKGLSMAANRLTREVGRQVGSL